MTATQTDVKTKAIATGSNEPGRATRGVKIVMDGESLSPWVNKQGFGVVNFQWATFAALVVKFKGRYLDEDGNPEGETFIGDKDGVPITLDLAQAGAADGSTLPLDNAAPFDEIAIFFPGADSGTYYFGLAG